MFEKDFIDILLNKFIIQKIAITFLKHQNYIHAEDTYLLIYLEENERV